MNGSGAVHVTTQRRHYTGKDGRERVYETHLLRRSWREDGKVRNETVANLSRLPGETIELIRRSLAGEKFIPAAAARGGPVAAAWACRRGVRHGLRARFPRAARPAVPGTGPGVRAGHLPGAAPGLQAGHDRLVGRRDPRPRPRRGRRIHR